VVNEDLHRCTLSQIDKQCQDKYIAFTVVVGHAAATYPCPSVKHYHHGFSVRANMGGDACLRNSRCCCIVLGFHAIALPGAIQSYWRNPLSVADIEYLNGESDHTQGLTFTAS
jgi:hypothetical protein